MTQANGKQHDLSQRALTLLDEQKREWAMLREGAAALDDIQTRTIPLNGFNFRLQFNPKRLASSAAKVDPKTIAQRKCFLCPANLPAPTAAGTRCRAGGWGATSAGQGT